MNAASASFWIQTWRLWAGVISPRRFSLFLALLCACFLCLSILTTCYSCLFIILQTVCNSNADNDSRQPFFMSRLSTSLCLISIISQLILRLEHSHSIVCSFLLILIHSFISCVITVGIATYSCSTPRCQPSILRSKPYKGHFMFCHNPKVKAWTPIGSDLWWIAIVLISQKYSLHWSP